MYSPYSWLGHEYATVKINFNLKIYTCKSHDSSQKSTEKEKKYLKFLLDWIITGFILPLFFILVQGILKS